MSPMKNLKDYTMTVIENQNFNDTNAPTVHAGPMCSLLPSSFLQMQDGSDNESSALVQIHMDPSHFEEKLDPAPEEGKCEERDFSLFSEMNNTPGQGAERIDSSPESARRSCKVF